MAHSLYLPSRHHPFWLFISLPFFVSDWQFLCLSMYSLLCVFVCVYQCMFMLWFLEFCCCRALYASHLVTNLTDLCFVPCIHDLIACYWCILLACSPCLLILHNFLSQISLFAHLHIVNHQLWCWVKIWTWTWVYVYVAAWHCVSVRLSVCLSV